MAALGKTPVLTPPTPHTSHGLHMLQSHWSLAVSLVSVFGGNLSPSRLDKVLLSAGYSDGPFQMMKKVRVFLFLYHKIPNEMPMVFSGRYNIMLAFLGEI